MDWLRLSKPVIASFFILVYFGVLLTLHNVTGHLPPSTFKELFSHPTDHFYYPNLIGIAYDLVGNPLFFVFLAVIRYYIPRQFLQLDLDGLIKEKDNLSPLERIVHFISLNNRVQVIVGVIFPFIASLFLAFQSVQIFQPVDIPAKYAIFLSFLGSYAILVILVQLAYIFLILRNYSFNVKINLSHPDNCSGLAPFGNLAIIIYAFLFFWAMFQAIGTSAGGSALQKAITTTTGSITLIYLWLLFPLASIYIFDRLVYQPHIALFELRRQYLETFSRIWTERHQQIRSKLRTTIEFSKSPRSKKGNHDFNSELEILQTWVKLDQYVIDMHTWPISKSTFQILGTFANPLIPILLPAIIGLVKSLLS